MISWLLLAQLQFGAPVTRIGAVDDTAHAITFVFEVLEDRARRVAVLQRRTPFVPIFDATGKRVGTLGRRGGGPGEFAGPSTAGFLGDTLWIADFGLNKFVLYDAVSLAHLGDRILTPTGAGREYPIALTKAGPITTTTASQQGTRAYRIAGLAPAVVVPIGNANVRLTLSSGVLSVTNPFTDAPLVFVAQSSSFLVLERTRRDTLVFRSVTPQGDVSGMVEVPFPSRAVTNEMLQEEVSQLFASMRGAPISRANLEKAYFEAMRGIAYTSAIERVVLTANGSAWITQRAERGAKRLVHVDVLTGKVLGSHLDLQGRTVVAGSRQFVWLLEKDSTDVEFLVKRPVIN